MESDKIWLWLDDERPAPQGYHVTVKTAQEAIEWLKTGKVGQISLDHDLGDETAVGTGYQVATWIEEAAFKNELKPFIVVLHTANPVGRDKMLISIKNAERYWERDGHL